MQAGVLAVLEPSALVELEPEQTVLEPGLEFPGIEVPAVALAVEHPGSAPGRVADYHLMAAILVAAANVVPVPAVVEYPESVAHRLLRRFHHQEPAGCPGVVCWLVCHSWEFHSSGCRS